MEQKSSERIKKAYIKSKLTYAELAKLTGQKVNTLGCWITGKRNPPDWVADFIEEKVNNYLNGGGEYINKEQCRDKFANVVYDKLPQKQATEIMKAFDSLPTVSINNK